MFTKIFSSSKTQRHAARVQLADKVKAKITTITCGAVHFPSYAEKKQIKAQKAEIAKAKAQKTALKTGNFYRIPGTATTSPRPIPHDAEAADFDATVFAANYPDFDAALGNVDGRRANASTPSFYDVDAASIYSAPHDFPASPAASLVSLRSSSTASATASATNSGYSTPVTGATTPEQFSDCEADDGKDDISISSDYSSTLPKMSKLSAREILASGDAMQRGYYAAVHGEREFLFAGMPAAKHAAWEDAQEFAVRPRKQTPREIQRNAINFGKPLPKRTEVACRLGDGSKTTKTVVAW